MFDGAYLKLERANKHIDDLQAQLIKFSMQDLHTATIVHFDTSGQNTLQITFTQKSPKEWPLIIGDALQNMRAALDLVIYGFIPNPRVHFPFHEERSNLADALRNGKISTLPTKMIDVILNDIQPYEAGNYTLWAMNKLCILDKHRLVIPALDWGSVRNFSAINKDTGEIISGMTFFAGPAGALFDLGRGNLEIKNKGIFAPRILFGIDTYFHGAECVPKLREMHATTQKTVDRLKQSIS